MKILEQNHTDGLNTDDGVELENCARLTPPITCQAMCVLIDGRARDEVLLKTALFLLF